MKKINWKILIITCIVCLSPIVLGIIFYQQLPKQMPIHFNINNEANGYAPKNFALFGIPIILTGFQVLCCIISDIQKNKELETPKFITIVKWIIPILDVRKSICLIMGILFILTGNYLPKMSYEIAKGKMHPMPKNETMYRKMTRMWGYSFVIGGISLLISVLFSVIFTIAIIIVLLVSITIEGCYCLLKK